MTNPEIQGREVAPLSPEHELEQEVQRLIHNPEKNLPKEFFGAVKSLLNSSDKKDVLSEE